MTVQKQLIASERLLERGAHEGIPRPRLREDRKVDIEEREVNKEGNEDQTNSSRCEVAIEVILKS